MRPLAASPNRSIAACGLSASKADGVFVFPIIGLEQHASPKCHQGANDMLVPYSAMHRVIPMCSGRYYAPQPTKAEKTSSNKTSKSTSPPAQEPSVPRLANFDVSKATHQEYAKWLEEKANAADKRLTQFDSMRKNAIDEEKANKKRQTATKGHAKNANFILQFPKRHKRDGDFLINTEVLQPRTKKTKQEQKRLTALAASPKNKLEALAAAKKMRHSPKGKIRISLPSKGSSMFGGVKFAVVRVFSGGLPSLGKRR